MNTEDKQNNSQFEEIKGDKVGGDKVGGDKNIYYQALPTSVFNNNVLIKYYDEKNGELYKNKILRDSRITLENIYIEPYFDIYKNCFTQTTDVKSNESNFYLDNNNFCNPKSPFSIHSFINNIILSNPLPALVFDNHCLQTKGIRLLFILGQPGQGKTSLCHRLFYDFTSQLNNHKPVFYIRLRDIPDKEINKLIHQPLESITQEVQELLDDGSFSKMDLKKSIIILDGLDELAITSQLEESYINTFCDNLQLVIDKHQDLQIIVTSRLHYIDLQKINAKHSRSLILHLKGLSIQQQKKWLVKYNNYSTEQFPEEKLIKYQEQSNHKPKFKNLYELLQLPILLYLIVKVKKDLTESINKTEVYREVFKVILERPHSDKQTPVLRNVNKDHYLNALQDIAFEIFKSRHEYIHQSEILDIPSVQNIPNFKDSLENLLVSFYFKKVRENNSHKNLAVEFLHKSLQEYLTSEKIWRGFLDIIQRGKDNHFRYNSEEKIFKKIASLLSHRRFTKEIEEYILQIIQNSSLKARRKISERLVQSFFLFLQSDFIYKEHSHIDFTTIQSTNFCYNFWLILNHLLPEKDYFSSFLDNEANIFMDYLRRVNIKGLSLKYQDLSGINMDEVSLKNANLVQVNLDNTSLIKANLSYANLSGASLIEANLSYANLDNASLIGAKFSKFNKTDWDVSKQVSSKLQYINFNNANLRNANLRGLNLSDLNLNRVNFNDADLSYAILTNTLLNEVDFSNANLRRIDFSGAVLKKIQFIRTNLIGAKFKDANLDGIDLSNSKLGYNNFLRASLVKAILSESNLINTNLNEAILRQADLSRANISNSSLNQANLQEANLIGVNLDEAYLHYANLTRVILVSAILINTDFKNANLHYANLSRSNLHNAKFVGATLSNTNLSEANLRATDLSNTDFRNANLQKSNLQKAKLVNANLIGADLFETNLKEADLSGAILIDTSIINISLNEVNLSNTIIINAVDKK